mmetsp:Transcript_21638/g.62991  ORF Transcript_21638/g.62991 Transcript_21638/m.62991 type:complete len:366 (+) Transcript_21638:365-1462(+)
MCSLGDRRIGHRAKRELCFVHAPKEGDDILLSLEARKERLVSVYSDMGGDLLRWIDLVLGPGVAHAAHKGLESGELGHGVHIKGQGLVIFLHLRPRRDHDRVMGARKLLPERLGHKRHEWVEKAQAGVEDVDQDPPGLQLLFRAPTHPRLGRLDVPICVLVPHELVDLLPDVGHAVLLESLSDGVNELVALGDDVALGHGKRVQLLLGHGPCHREGLELVLVQALEVAQKVAASVPELVREVAVSLDLLHGERNVLPRSHARHQGVAERIRAVLVDGVQRVNDVALGLAHLLPLGVAHEAVHVDHLEGRLARELDAHHHHARDPEEDDVVPGFKDRRRVELVEVRTPRRPAHRRKGPETAREPRV